MKYILILLIKLYQTAISKFKPPCCRFYPTCSAYGITAIRRFGAIRGGYLTLNRILRCNPFSAGGFDPVPEYWGQSRAEAAQSAMKKKDKGHL